MNDPSCYPHTYVPGSPLCAACQPVLHAYAASGELARVLDTRTNPFDSYEFYVAWWGDAFHPDAHIDWARRWDTIGASIGRVFDAEAMYARCGMTPSIVPSGRPMIVSSGASRSR
jgi:hypothetical protein